MGILVLVRHGESRWNLDNRFTGWVDVPLSQNGIREAERVADYCQQFEYSAAFTSNLTRAQETLLIILARQDLTGVFQHSNDYRHPDWIRRSNQPSVKDIPVYVSAELNERYYGSLQGLSKRAAEKKYGKDQVWAWRRGYEDHPPGGESLKETQARVQPYLTKHILPRVRLGESVIVAAHGNTLRAVIKHLEGISDEDIARVDLPEARPLVYHYRRGKFVRVEGDYQFSRPLR